MDLLDIIVEIELEIQENEKLSSNNKDEGLHDVELEGIILKDEKHSDPSVLKKDSNIVKQSIKHRIKKIYTHLKPKDCPRGHFETISEHMRKLDPEAFYKKIKRSIGLQSHSVKAIAFKSKIVDFEIKEEESIAMYCQDLYYSKQAMPLKEFAYIWTNALNESDLE